MPRSGDEHPDDDTCVVSSIDASPISDSGTHFEILVEYTADEDGGIVVPDNPLNRPPEVSWNSSEATAPYFVDCSIPPRAVVNSAGEPFEQYLEREEGELGITITTNEPSFDAAAADELSHTINAGPVAIDTTTFATGTLTLSPIQAQKIRERVETDGVVMLVTCYRKTYNLKARREGWTHKPLDAGLNERVGDLATGFKLKPILNVNNQPVKKPWPLDGSGKKTSGDPNAEPQTLESKPYKEANWAFVWCDPSVWN